MENNKKICFISCVNDEILYEECLRYINSLYIPEGFSIQTIGLRNSGSITEAYNQAMRNSDAKYKVYLHQDVFIINKNFILDIINIFSNNKNIGMLGVAGAKELPESVTWWESHKICGRVCDSHTNYMKLYNFDEFDHKFEKVKVIDGLIMITQYDIKWREDLFNGWHFYDISQCMEFNLANYDIVIPKQDKPWCIHDCGIVNTNNGYDKYKKIFLKEYNL